MELIGFIIEGLGFLLELFDIVFMIADAIAWLKGKENRMERKAAKKTGNKPPKRNSWNRAFILFFILVIIFTALIVIRHLR